MIRLGTKIQLGVFALITVLGIAYVGASYIGINPFHKLTAAEIRHLCIQNHERLEQVRNLFSSGDTTEADEIQKLLLEAGIDSKVEPSEDEADALVVLVPEESVEAAQDAIELLTEPDDLISDA